jgi:N utilization substance protein B
VFRQRLEDTPLPDALADFARGIVYGVLPLIEKIDQAIAGYAPEWPLDQIATIDRNILRMATWEFAVQRETPVKVAINEAVELAKMFGSDSAPRFVNGVLGSLAQHQNEISQILRSSHKA